MSFGEFVLILIIIWLVYLLDRERKLNGRPGVPIFDELFNPAPTTAEEPHDHPPFNADELRELEKAKHKKSPPPEKPEGEVKSSRSTRTAQTQSDRTNSLPGVNNKSKREENNNAKKQQSTPLVASPTPTATPPPAVVKKHDDSSRQTRQSLYLPAPGEKSPNVASSAPTATPPPAVTRKQDDSSRQTRQSLYLPAPGEKAPDAIPPVRTPTTSTYLPVAGENPMLNDSNYQLRSSASNASLPGSSANSDSSASVEGDKNPDDLLFVPAKKLTFNGPFDYQAITYHMSVKNNSRKWIAYAIKSNAIPRVTAMPPSGILKPGDKHNVAITVQKFNYYDMDVSKDRIAFDYLFCPAETKVFTHSLLQGTATRRRKNIKIEYNP